jgi:predicted TPR repeat methyltransferase
MNILQPLDDLEKFWGNPDPWGYENNPDDLNRRAKLLSVLPEKEYQKVLDLGCRNGFVTTHLPGKEITGLDLSINVVKHV